MNDGYEVKPMIPGEGAMWGIDMGKGPDYVGISSIEYKRLRDCESEFARYKQEAEKIPQICPRIYTKTQKGLVSCIYKGCPQICPNWRGGSEK